MFSLKLIFLLSAFQFCFISGYPDSEISYENFKGEKCEEGFLWDPYARLCKSRNPDVGSVDSSSSFSRLFEPARQEERSQDKLSWTFPFRSGIINMEERRQCENDFFWNPYRNQCQKLVCALPGYVVKGGKCVKELDRKRRSRPFNFTFPILINDTEIRPNCQNGYMYDPYFKKCRKISCATGYVFKEGKCVKE